MRPWTVVVVLLPLLTAGCFQLLREGPSTTLGFTCAVLDPAQADAVVVESWLGPDVRLNATPVLARLVEVLAGLSGRSLSAFSIAQREGPAVPAGGWDRVRLAAEAGPYLGQRTVTLRVLWVGSMAEPATGFVARPGTVVVALDSVMAGAQQVGRPVEPVALAVLLHQVGHALGLVNQGVPVQDPDIQEREGPAGHDRDPAAVLNAAWDDARTLAWAGNATYDHFGAADRADWAAARGPGGVCT
ncbi:MAG TPA: hypothetical protein VM241_06350 [Candidatus Thermoplasmatota archaeon]|nr:hypothetical protein [Candidatus Thermoplasmatota archaeon]